MATGINDFIAKGVNTISTVQQIQGAVGEFLPQGLNDSINKLFGRSESTTGKSISEFQAFLSKKNGLARTNRFYISIVPEGGSFLSGNQTIKDIPLLAESASLPGIGLATSEVRRYGYGATERMPTFPIFVDTNISFLGDNTGEIHKFFYTWMNGIVTYGSGFGETSASPTSNQQSFEVNYKKKYQCTINIVTVDERNNKIISVTLNKAFPTFIGDVALSWADNDNVMRIPVTFSYFNWKRDDIDVSGLFKEGGNILTNIQKVVKISNAIQTLASLSKPNSVADVLNVVNQSKVAVSAIRNF